MTEEEIAFQVELWDAVSRWADGNMEAKIQAASDVNRAIRNWSAGFLDRLQKEIGLWQAKTFPESTKKTILTHFGRELRELKVSDKPSELADMLHLLIAYANKLGVSLMSETLKKFSENQNRKWGEPDQDGVREHVRDVDAGDPT